MIRPLWNKIFVEPQRQADAEAREYGAAHPGFDRKVAIVLITCAISLTVLEYFAMSNRYPTVVAMLDMVGGNGWACRLDAAMDRFGVARYCSDATSWMVAHPTPVDHSAELNRLIYWSLGCMLAYFVIPAFVVKGILREKLMDYGFRLKGALKDAWIYVLMFAVVAPLVVLVSFDSHFQETYPFYTLAEGERLWPRFWAWEVMYFVQFLSLEFFFRGFLVHGTRQRLGYYSIFVMMVPYCMIHFGKPMPETFGAIIAGIALGSLSLKARSIWLGVAIHVSVALSMDFASLWQQGYF
jgi:membrane protease YdiL (CAAX protease family)